MKTDHKTQFETDGYYIYAEPILDRALVEAACDGMEKVIAGEYDTGVAPEPSKWKPGGDPQSLVKIEQPQKASRAIANVVGSPRLGELAAALTGAKMIQLWWVQLLRKPPSSTTEAPRTNIGWHRDWTYWIPDWHDGSEVFTVWVALSDVEENCGPMKFVSGSHLWENPGGGDFLDQTIDQSRFSVPAGATWQEKAALMSAGGCSFHHRLTLHGSGPNLSEGPRCSLAIHLRTEKSRPLVDTTHARFIDNETICPVIYGQRVNAQEGTA